MFRIITLLLLVATAPLGAQTSTVFLVRHAERAEDDPRDPNLSPAGRERAVRLAALLADAGIERVFSTDFRRTQQTAAPIAEQVGLRVESYDPRGDAFAGFADRVRESGDRILVVGHSNTTPALVELLGGTPGGPIGEGEYDRLYVVTIDASGHASTVLLRF